MIIKLLVEAGNMKPGPSLSQKLGPLGINIGKVIAEVNKATSGFKGKIPVVLDVNTKTKEFKIEVKTPPTSELLKAELEIEKAGGAGKYVANAAIEQIIKVAKIKQKDLLCSFEKVLKNVLGTCLSCGILVENKSPKEIIKEIEAGKYAEEIKKQKDAASKEKLAFLKEYLERLVEKEKKKEEKEEEKEEEKKEGEKEEKGKRKEEKKEK